VTALAGGTAASTYEDLGREADLARVAGFDHTMRLAYGINAAQGSDATPSVQYWRGRNGEVDYAFEIDGVPVPVGLAYRQRDREASLAAVREFLEAYDSSVGFLLAGDTVADGEAVERLGERVVELPYWLYLLVC
jgi:hypothetical protein